MDFLNWTIWEGKNDILKFDEKNELAGRVGTSLL